MIPYQGGDDLGAIVAEVGHHSTKMGFAGEDSPRALFRSDVAVLRSSDQAKSVSYPNPSAPKKGSKQSTPSKLQQQQKQQQNRRPKIDLVQFDLSTPFNTDGGTGQDLSSPINLDGDWEAENPIDPITGLISYDDETTDATSSSSDSLELFSQMIDHGVEHLCVGRRLPGGDDGGRLLSLDRPMLLVEKSYNTPRIRQKLTEILFEQFHAPALFLGRDAVMSCYAVGRVTGVVVDIGGLGTTVSPVHEGWVENRGVLRGPIGGDVMDGAMLETIDRLCANAKQNGRGQQLRMTEAMPGYQMRTKNHQKRKNCFHRLSRMEMARHCKEAVAAVAESGYDPNDAQHATAPITQYELPDGTRVEIGQERYEMGELLMGRDDGSSKRREELCARKKKASEGSGLPLAGMGEWTAATVQNMVCDSAFRCDRDQQAQLLGNLVLSGGGACIDGIVDRLGDEVESIIHTHTPGWRVKVLSPDPAERSVCSWLGASILASLGTFQEMYMTKAEYEENGATLVNRKCP